MKGRDNHLQSSVPIKFTEFAHLLLMDLKEFASLNLQTGEGQARREKST